MNEFDRALGQERRQGFPPLHGNMERLFRGLLDLVRSEEI